MILIPGKRDARALPGPLSLCLSVCLAGWLAGWLVRWLAACLVSLCLSLSSLPPFFSPSLLLSTLHNGHSIASICL